MKKYDEWNEIKKQTISKKINIGIKPREIFWVKIGQNIGSEEYGKGKNFTRPVIVVRKLTRELFIGIPTTTTLKTNDYFHQFKYYSKKDGDIEVSAMILQFKVFSVQRLTNRIGMINKDDFKKVVEKSMKLFAPT
ncbi:MAG: type II toxin-antitoxin system PemK/MazF family toxin [Campylobacterota bacterium]|nr:type II toxin-antitoxin system PemK/MazF family toxin [Campylobacterota bacterium]